MPTRLIQDFPDAGIQVLNGRYGPYITDKKKNAKIPKERDPKSLTLEECRALLAAAPERGGRFGRWGREQDRRAATGHRGGGRRHRPQEEAGRARPRARRARRPAPRAAVGDGRTRRASPTAPQARARRTQHARRTPRRALRRVRGAQDRAQARARARRGASPAAPPPGDSGRCRGA